MKGQWIGRFTGTTAGTVIVNVDELSDSFQGMAYLLQDDEDIANSMIGFNTLTKNNNFTFVTKNLSAINKWPGLFISHDDLIKIHPKTIMPESAQVKGGWTEKYLSLSWTTNLGTIGTCKLKHSKNNQKSTITSKKISWEGFKKHISNMESKNYLFRGQKKPWRLKTSFHRTSRYDLQRFISEDIQALHKHLSARTKHLFNLEIPNENGSFINLVRHHGYPTPILDWTFSPFVAAYFAYKNISKDEINSASKKDRVRILLFNQIEWKKDFSQYSHLTTGRLHLSVAEFIAIENDRMIPQQSATTVTNIDDIESYILNCEKSRNKTYFQAFDLPLLERGKVIQELKYMGITAGSMFPGLDGACEELMDRNFEL